MINSGQNIVYSNKKSINSNDTSFFDGFGRPGGGAPARNERGEVVTNVRSISVYLILILLER